MTNKTVKFASAMIPVTLVFIACLSIWQSEPFDSTDNPPNRSNMMLHVDAATGCEYLSVYRGGITPRLTKTGKQAGCK